MDKHNQDRKRRRLKDVRDLAHIMQLAPLFLYIYADESDKGTHFDKWQVKQRDAKMSFVDRKNVENVALPP